MTAASLSDAYLEAVELIKASLPRQTTLGGLVKLSLDGPATAVAFTPGSDAEESHGPTTPSIFIDGRESGPAKLLSEEEGEAFKDEDFAAIIKTSPLVIRRVGRGLSDIRWAVVNPLRLTTEGDHMNQRVTCRFGDALAGKQVTNCSLANLPGKLPVATEDVSQIKKDLREFGYAFVKNALKKDQLEALQIRTKEQSEAEEENGWSLRDGGVGNPNQRIHNLVSKGQEYIDLLEHPIVDEVVGDFLLDPDFCLYSYSVNISRPGSQSMFIHSDQLFLDPPSGVSPAGPSGVNIMWFLSDVTEINGGTRVFPGSHKDNVLPADLVDTTESIFASGPAGTAMIFESRLWHATGANTDTSGERPVILSFFVGSSLRGQENFYIQTDPKVEEGMSDKVKGYLGWRSLAGINQVMGGKESQGRLWAGKPSIAKRPLEIIGRLTPKGKATTQQ